MAEYIERETAISEVMAAKWQNGTDGAMAMQIVAGAPAADVAPVRRELRKAVKLLDENYEKGVRNPVIRDPLAWALYQTWKAMDEGADNDAGRNV